MVNRRSFFKKLAAVAGATVSAKALPDPTPIPGTWGAVTRSVTPYWDSQGGSGYVYGISTLDMQKLLEATQDATRYKPDA